MHLMMISHQCFADAENILQTQFISNTPQRKEDQMDSLDQVIKDMDEEYNLAKNKNYYVETVLYKYLTRLKALRDTLPHPPHPTDTNRPISTDSTEHDRS
jgi:hypothetical protein